MTDSSSFRQSRRRYLSIVAGLGGSLALSGCATEQDGSPRQVGATDVVAFNETASSKTVTIAITDVDAEEVHTERTFELAANGRTDPVNRGKLPLNTDYRIEASVEDGPSETFDWEAPSIERAPLWILFDDSRNIRFLLQVG